MSPSKKHLALGAALVATSVAAFFSPEPVENQGVALSDRSLRAATVPAAKPAETATPRSASTSRGKVANAEVLEIRSRRPSADDASAAQAFAAQTWSAPAPVKKVVAPVVAEVVAPAPPPMAPPLPFKALGRYEEDGQVVIFLQYRDSNLAVRLGDTIAEQYKVEGLQGSVLTLRHLPTDQTQTLDVGSAS